jgi:DNA-binding GntR family transcriptional regulator
MGMVCGHPARCAGSAGGRAVSTAILERSSTASRVTDVLRERISRGAAAPGSRIVELEVARELGVSRSPVREALLRLAQEGLVTILPYRGAIVVPLQRRRLVELMEFRLALEHFALERLVERADETLADLRAAVAAIRRSVQTRNRRRIVDADLAMHRTIVGSARNVLLERAYDGLLAQIRLYIDVTSARYERVEELAEEHEALLRAIERRDLAAARALLDAHIRHGFEDAAAETSQPATGRNARRIATP